MVTRSSDSEDRSSLATPAMPNRAHSAPTCSASTIPILTPSSTTFTFGEQRASSASFNFRPQTASNRTNSAESTTPGTPLFTPSSTAFLFGDNHDPDRRLPSIEREPVFTGRSRSSSSRTLYTPPVSTRADSAKQTQHPDTVLQQIEVLQNLELTPIKKPGSSSSGHDTPTPSIHVVPSAVSNESSQSQSSRAESLADGVAALRIGSLGAKSRTSPTPTRRRRSGSGIKRELYQIENEEPPQSLFHKQKVQNALANARTLTSRIVNVLSSSILHRENGSSIQSLHQQAIKLDDFQLPLSRIVGLVGDSGVGKSSLINCLLDKPDLARASSSGTACTCAVTEFIFHDREDFIIYVDYFSLDELKKQFEELLRAYRDYHYPSGNSRGRQKDAKGNGDEQNLEQKAKLAKGTFTASFGSVLEETPTVLSSMPFEHAVGKMIEWASQLLPVQQTQESYTTAKTCSARLAELTSELDTSAGGKFRTRWPFIQKLRVHLKAYILSKGLIIADLPGLRDLNSARKAITERYVRRCHQIFVVAKIDRAVTDDSIKEIFALAGRANLSKIDIVVTRSEEINIQEAKRDWPAEAARIEEMETMFKADERRIKSLEQDIYEYEQDLMDLDQEEKQQLMKWKEDLRRAEQSREDQNFALIRHVVELRNEKVSNGLRREYQTYLMAQARKTFCVSKELYWSHREEPLTAALPYVRLSGIPELRRYCIGIVAESHLRATKEFINDEIPAFLGSVELWVEAGSGNTSAERKEKILNAVSAIQREIDELTSPVSQLNGISHSLRQEWNNQIHLCMEQSRSHWTLNARRASMDWQGWHHSSYKAFCSNYGDHCTPKIGYRCWNGEAMEAVKDDMSAVWDSFAVDLKANLDQIHRVVVQAFDNGFRIANTAQPDEAQSTLSAMRTLAGTLRHRKYLTQCGIEQASEVFYSELASLRTDAFSSIRTAFLGRLMEDTYHVANMEYGSGSDRRRKDLITGKFGCPSLFSDHRRDCKDNFRDIAHRLQDQVSDIVNQQIVCIETDLRMLRSENVVLESERDPKFRNRVGAEVEKVRAEMKPVESALDDTI